VGTSQAITLRSHFRLGIRDPPSTSIQAMVAKRRSLTERFSYCLTQFTRDYNWICRCINKKSSENLNSFAASGHKVLQACRCGFCAGLRASRWFWVRALGCGVLSQSTSGPPRVTTWSNSGKPGRERIHLRRRYRGWIGTAGKLGAGLAAPASVAPARLAVSASRPETESLEPMAATTSCAARLTV